MVKTATTYTTPSSADIASAPSELLKGVKLYAVKQLPELWDKLTPEQQAEAQALIHKLDATLGKLAAVTEEAARQAQIEKNQGLIALLDSWIKEDAQGDHEEQELEWQEFEKALDEDRFSLPERNLFS